MARDALAKRLPGRASGDVWRHRGKADGYRRPRSPGLDAQISPVWEVVPGVDQTPDTVGFSALLKRDALFRRSLALVDVIAAYLALLFAVHVVSGPGVALTPDDVLLAPLVVLVSKAIGLYDRDQHLLRKTTIDEIPSILHLSVFYALVVWLGEAFLFDGWLARAQVFGLAVASFALTTLGRWLARTIALSRTSPERCIVLGNPSDSARIADKLRGSKAVKADVIGRVSLGVGAEGVLPGTPNLGDFRSLATVVARYDIERVIIAPGGAEQEEILDAIRLVKAMGVKVSVLPRLLEVVGSSSSFDDVDGICLLGVRPYGLTKSSSLLKRAMDVAGATVTLLLLSPLFIVLVIAIKLDSRGPVFFRQPRIGRRGDGFWMLKFRSMVDGADRMKDNLRGLNEAEGGLFKISEDPRITSVGRFLRRTSLDELPQLLNVLRGDMSLVGPRPLVPDEDALIEGWQRRRLAVKPGMTGLWQIFGSSRIPMQEMVKIDYIYGANWSIWLDLKILLRTIPYVFSKRGL